MSEIVGEIAACVMRLFLIKKGGQFLARPFYESLALSFVEGYGTVCKSIYQTSERFRWTTRNEEDNLNFALPVFPPQRRGLRPTAGRQNAPGGLCGGQPHPAV